MGRILSKKNRSKVSFIKVKHFLEDVESALTVNNQLQSSQMEDVMY